MRGDGCLQLFVLNGTACRSLPLTDLPEGRFEIHDQENGRLICRVSGGADGWHVQPAASLSFPAGDQDLLAPGRRMRLLENGGNRQYMLFPTAGSHQGRAFARCLVPEGFTLTVGSAGDNELVCAQGYVSGHHLVLRYSNRAWHMKSLDSHLGVYVNGRRCGEKALCPGDTVSVLEQKLIVLPGLLAFNSPDGKTALRAGSALTLLKPPHISAEDAFTSTPLEDFFYRAPRFSQGMDNPALTVDSPPAPHEPSQTNALLTMAPGLLMGVVSLAVATNPLLPLASLAGATIFPFLNRRNTEKQQAEDEEKRKAAYQAYLNDIEAHIADVTGKQEKLLRSRIPPTRERVAALLKDQHRLWSRNSAQQDYLELRLGTGEIPLQYDITFPQDHFEAQSDPMKQLMQQLRDRARKLEDVPITLPLARFACLGVAARRSSQAALAGNLVMQLAMDYGYDEMKLCFIGDMPGLEPFAWLPHTWDNSRKNHLVARDRAELQHLLPVLDGMLAGRLLEKRSEDSVLEYGEAELVVFIFDGKAAQSGVVSRMLLERHYRGVRVVAFSEHSRMLPRRCDSVISVHQGEGRMIWQEDSGSKSLSFRPEESAAAYGEAFASTLANLYLELPDTASHMPDTVSFLELFQVGDVQSLNVLSRWKRSDPTASMAAPVGVDEDGSVCFLDVHERGDGQHGLIAGMTGSGKSEFIMTYILSMAVCFSPEDVAFLLIDYKGGGMAKAFEHLPHTAGIITNLDGNAISRSLLAIQSELVRRQEIFHSAEQALDLSGMNIIKYQRLYREKRVDTPMPHLLIITDEFAELKSQEPEFMQQLISASRIGRSLGVHLILATQKPSGVVDDQIWSNTNWRVCLRVQDARDSQDVIKCPDAAALPGVGRFYIQVGYGMLKQAQSGFTGAPYLPGSQAANAMGVDVLDPLGQVLQHSELPRAGRKGKTEYQLNAVIRHLQQAAELQHMAVQPIWLPPLEERISLSALREKYRAADEDFVLEPLVGEIDDPATQSRALLRAPLWDGKNTLLFGGAGSGKALFLQAALEDMLLRHGPEELNLYLLDYAGDGFEAYLDAPQVGDVLSTQDDEKLLNLLRSLILEVERRKKLLGGSMEGSPLAGRLKQAGLPNLLVVFHHVHVLKEKLNDDLAKLLKLLRDGPRYGVAFLATSMSPSLVGFKLQEAFARTFVLQMDREDDYSMLLGRTGGFRPEAVRGRGVIRRGGLCEYQTAAPDLEPEELCRQVQTKWPGQKAPAVRVLPQRVTAEALRQALDPQDPLVLPVGLDCVTLDPVLLDLKKRYVHLVLGDADAAAAFCGEWASLLGSTGKQVTLWGSDLIGGKPVEGVRYVPAGDSVGFFGEVFGEMNAVAVAMAQNVPPPPVAEKLIVMPDFPRVAEHLKQDPEGKAYPRFISYLTKLKPLYRCTIMLCASAQALKTVQYEEWFKTQVSNTEGLYLGGGVEGQYILTVSNGLALSKTETAFPFGFEIQGGKGRRVKFLSDRYGEM